MAFGPRKNALVDPSKTPEEDMADLRAMATKFGVDIPEDDDQSSVMEDDDFQMLQLAFDLFDMDANVVTNLSEVPGLSRSLHPEKCATAPEICYWAGSSHFRKWCTDLRAAAVYDNNLSDQVVRKFATINTALRRSWYSVPRDQCWMYPDGATGKKQKLPEPLRGCKGLKRPWENDIPTNDYVPMGVSRKLENRPQIGRWFYPQQSALRNEYKPE
ncbi:hypothetical protein JOL62DRAFT_613577 [Phyllosticta paracitricarpa]|uniref:Uncharacterized protein n=1 Tax=Phyllosticta paracitricarpa TaxID=2016321 RepID=A0ABR1N245_9PEZI